MTIFNLSVSYTSLILYTLIFTCTNTQHDCNVATQTVHNMCTQTTRATGKRTFTNSSLFKSQKRDHENLKKRRQVDILTCPKHYDTIGVNNCEICELITKGNINIHKEMYEIIDKKMVYEILVEMLREIDSLNIEKHYKTYSNKDLSTSKMTEPVDRDLHKNDVEFLRLKNSFVTYKDNSETKNIVNDGKVVIPVTTKALLYNEIFAELLNDIEYTKVDRIMEIIRTNCDLIENCSKNINKAIYFGLIKIVNGAQAFISKQSYRIGAHLFKIYYKSFNTVFHTSINSETRDLTQLKEFLFDCQKQIKINEQKYDLSCYYQPHKKYSEFINLLFFAAPTKDNTNKPLLLTYGI